MDKKNAKKIISLLEDYKGWVAFSILCTLITIFFNIVTPYILKNLMDTAINLNLSSFFSYLYLVVAVIIVDCIVIFFQKYSLNKYTIYFIADMRNSMTSHVQDLSIVTLKNYNSGDIVSRLNNDVAIAANFLKGLPEVICQPILMVAALTYMIKISLKLTIATVILIPITSVLFDKINKPMEKHSKEVMEESSKINSMLQDVISGIYVVKAFNLNKILCSKFISLSENIKNKSLKISKLHSYVTPIYLALRLIPQLVCPIYGGYLALNKEITLGDLLAFTMLIVFVFLPVEKFLGFLSQIRECKPAFSRIFEVIDESTENKDGKIMSLNNELLPLSFNNVTFSYDGKKDILKNVSFNLNRGCKMALVGPSGTGKSTILKLICKFYKSSEGNIQIFGEDTQNCTDESVQSLISYMSQESYLYPVTIAENIGIGKLGSTMDEIINAAKAANAHEFITKLPDGYNTIVKERGANLSGGQCQRISLARMIIKNAPIVLLDEPTASLDTKSEALIQESLEKFISDKTVIVVAHRLDTIKDSDKIIVLNEDRIEECGTHLELMEKDGLYKKLYLNQSSMEKEEKVC